MSDNINHLEVSIGAFVSLSYPVVHTPVVCRSPVILVEISISSPRLLFLAAQTLGF